MDARAPFGAVSDQVTGVFVDFGNQIREAASALALAEQQAALARALIEMQKVIDFIGSPEHILGSIKTKHGEIAEVLEVRVRNALELVRGNPVVATFEGVGRTAAADFKLWNRDFQAKWINGERNALDHILDHVRTYPSFSPGGGNYVIPAEQFNLFKAVASGEAVEGASDKTIRTILRKMSEVEAQTGKPFFEVVHKGVSTYADAQQGRVHIFVEEQTEELNKTSQDREEVIEKEHAASFGGALEAAAIAGLVSASISVAVSLYQKHAAGKNAFRGQFTQQDWQDVFGNAGSAALGGAVTGGALYLLTNFADMSAPLASAIVTATRGMAVLAEDLYSGKIDFNGFVDAGLIVCAEAAIIGVATAAAQVLIPIPVLGGVIGSISGRMLVSLAKTVSDDLSKRIEKDLGTFLGRLDAESAVLVASIEERFDLLGDLTTFAFDLEHNVTLLLSSVELGRAHGVPAAVLIHSDDDLDAFMLA
jgi:hypothetical protein